MAATNKTFSRLSAGSNDGDGGGGGWGDVSQGSHGSISRGATRDSPEGQMIPEGVPSALDVTPSSIAELGRTMQAAQRMSKMGLNPAPMAVATTAGGGPGGGAGGDQSGFEGIAMRPILSKLSNLSFKPGLRNMENFSGTSPSGITEDSRGPPSSGAVLGPSGPSSSGRPSGWVPTSGRGVGRVNPGLDTSAIDAELRSLVVAQMHQTDEICIGGRVAQEGGPLSSAQPKKQHQGQDGAGILMSGLNKAPSDQV